MEAPIIQCLKPISFGKYGSAYIDGTGLVTVRVVPLFMKREEHQKDVLWTVKGYSKGGHSIQLEAGEWR